jgi:hypothetical protein
MVASSRTATGEAEPEELDRAVGLEQEAPEDEDHDRSGGGDDPGGAGEAVGHRVVAVVGPVPLLLDPGQQEDLVVHREPEHDGEEHHRHERLDRCRLDAAQVAQPPPLEHRHDDPVGRPDRQQVHHDRLQRHEHRPEHGHQQQERQAEHRAEEQGQAVGEVVGEVDVDGDAARHGDVEARLLADGGEDVLPGGG